MVEIGDMNYTEVMLSRWMTFVRKLPKIDQALLRSKVKAIRNQPEEDQKD